MPITLSDRLPLGESGPVGRSLLGLAIGDCLSAGIKGWSAEAIRDAIKRPMAW
jgi:hypothetical protein